MTADTTAIKERLEKATPGPWVANQGDWYSYIVYQSSDRCEIAHIDTFDTANFIAHAPEDIAALLADLAATREQLIQALSERDMARAFNDQCERVAVAERRDRIAAQERERQTWERLTAVEGEREQLREALQGLVDATSTLRATGWPSFLREHELTFIEAHRKARALLAAATANEPAQEPKPQAAQEEEGESKGMKEEPNPYERCRSCGHEHGAHSLRDKEPCDTRGCQCLAFVHRVKEHQP